VLAGIGLCYSTQEDRGLVRVCIVTCTILSYFLSPVFLCSYIVLLSIQCFRLFARMSTLTSPPQSGYVFLAVEGGLSKTYSKYSSDASSYCSKQISS